MTIEYNLKELLRQTIPHLKFSADMAADEDDYDSQKRENDIQTQNTGTICDFLLALVE